MRIPTILLAAAIMFCQWAMAQDAVLLEKADVLPLALSDDFSFTKTKTFLNKDEREIEERQVPDEMISFERKRKLFGALTRIERQMRYGQYFTLFWNTKNPSDVTVRFEYRQEKLGPYVQAKEISYPGAEGNNMSEFSVTGDAFSLDGPVTSWRALLIQDGKIVALHSSFLWN